MSLRLSYFWFRRLCLVCFAVGVALRLLLAWANHPRNSYDDHIQPIQLTLEQKKIVAADACWECHQPFLFYTLSAVIAGVLNLQGEALLKTLQLVATLFSILTLVIIYLVLRRIRLPYWPSLVVFALVCFLPANIYMAALHSNDTMTYFVAALCLLYFLKLITSGFQLRWALVCGTLLVLTLFTKLSAIFLLFSITAFLFWKVLVSKKKKNVRKILTASLLCLSLPAGALAGKVIHDLVKYQRPLAVNALVFKADIAETKNRDQFLLNVMDDMRPGSLRQSSFFSFRIWQMLKMPVLTDENLDSVFTIFFSSFWYEVQPVFALKDQQYFAYLNGQVEEFSQVTLPGNLHFYGSALIASGLTFLFLLIYGLIQLAGRQASKRFLKPGIFEFCVIVTVLATLQVLALYFLKPIYAVLRPAYFLSGLPAVCLPVAIGFHSLGGKMKNLILISTLFFICLVSFYIVELSLFLKPGMWQRILY